jgi:hypothetical protein
MPRKNHTHTKAQGHKTQPKHREVMLFGEVKRPISKTVTLKVGEVSTTWAIKRGL